MEFGQAFSFQFKDPDWVKKILLAALISIIPIIGQIFLLGWALEITRRVIRREPELLPEIDFGAHLGKGFQAFIVGLVYSIPVFILSIPNSILPSIAASSNDSSGTMSTVTALVSVCCGGLILIYDILLLFVLPAAYGRLADQGTIGSAFSFGAVFGLVRAAPVAYLLVALGAIIGGIISGLGIIACGIGIFATYTYAATIIFQLSGQAYREAMHL